jgi:hypothetical protein
MSRPQVIGTVAAAVFLLAPPSPAKRAPVAAPRAVCAAISASGMTAVVDVMASAVALQITDPSGRSRQLTASLPRESDFCDAFFDKSGEFLAVGLGKESSGPQGLRMLVAKTAGPQWVADFAVKPRPGLHAPLSLLGFLGNSTSLVIRGSPVAGPLAKQPVSIGTLVVDTAGGPSPSSPFERTLSATMDLTFPDVTSNRLWYSNHPLFCPIESTTLTGKQSPGPRIDKMAVFCTLPDVIAFPDVDTVIAAASRSSRDSVWRIDLATGRGDKISLPPYGRFPKDDMIDGKKSASPDGQAVAFSRTLMSYGHFDNFSYEGADIVVVQVHPLRLLGIVRLENLLPRNAFAVDHRDGGTTLLLFTGSVWRHVQVKPGLQVVR